jgi:hypothetical protein
VAGVSKVSSILEPGREKIDEPGVGTGRKEQTFCMDAW